MKYVITCGDEGVQINEGTRLAVVGAGLKLDGFSEIVKTLKKLLGNGIAIASSEENSWAKQKLDLSTWEQTDASFQQQIASLADKEVLSYSGFLPFADPQELDHEIKGHMVRPRGIHIGTTVTFTLDGGEQTYHLGQYLISAEWVSSVDQNLAKQIIETQVSHYKSLSGSDLNFSVQSGGELGETLAAKNRALLEKFGYNFGE
jgi:hypothetical protein